MERPNQKTKNAECEKAVILRLGLCSFLFKASTVSIMFCFCFSYDYLIRIFEKFFIYLLCVFIPTNRAKIYYHRLFKQIIINFFHFYFNTMLFTKWEIFNFPSIFINTPSKSILFYKSKRITPNPSFISFISKRET